MMTAVETASESAERPKVRPGVAAMIVALAVLALAIGIDASIDNRRDELALIGPDGKPSPVALTIAGAALTVPADMIRFRGEQRGGQVREVDLLLHWPSLKGFSDGF